MKINNRLIINKPLQPQKNENNKSNNRINDNKKSFKNIFKNKIENSKIEFSKHAKERLKARNINISESELKRLQNGVKRADSKGSRDSLILVDNVAYIVSVKNNTVITAIDGDNMKEKVFTNIDSTVLM